MPILERLFNGINNLYNNHSRIGQIAFILLLAHPILLLSRYAQNSHDAITFFKLTSNLQHDLGVISLYLTIVTIILTLYLRPKYNIWKGIHKLLGVSLFLGALHVYLSPSYVLHNNIALSVYILGLASLAIILWIYKSIFGKAFVKQYKYTVNSITHLNDKVIEIEMTCNRSHGLQYTAGQFVFVSFIQNGISKEKHPFSIVSTPNSISDEDKKIKIAIKTLGDYTNILYDRLTLWADVIIEGPYGLFSYNTSKLEKQIWIAGGIGINPFISMAKDLYNNNNKFYKIDLYYAVKNKEEAIYIDTLLKLSRELSNFTLIPFYSDDLGFITADYIKSNTTDLLQRDILLCAPPTMIKSLKRQFQELGVEQSHLHSEEFDL